MQQLKVAMRLNRDASGEIESLDLVLPCPAAQLKRAEKNVAKEPRQLQPNLEGPRGEAQPLYRNSYRLEETISGPSGDHWLRFRIAQAFGYWSTRGKTRMWQRALDKMPAMILQQVINSWLKPDFRDVPTACQAGSAQHAAQQFLSQLGLQEEGSQTPTYPDEERDSEIRLRTWREALERIEQSASAFDTVTARKLDPRKFKEDDARGDRLITVDPDWQAFLASPFARKLPLNFVKSDHVVIWRRRLDDRLFAALPMIDGIEPDSKLWELTQSPKLGWWHKDLDEFSPLPAWKGASLTKGKRRHPRKLVLIPLSFSRLRWGKTRAHDPKARKSQARFCKALSGADGRKVCWSLLTTKRERAYLHIATVREVKWSLRPNVLGVHFGTGPIVWWAAADGSGNVLDEGKFENEILSVGLAEKLHLEEKQGRGQWVGGRQFAKVLKQRTNELVRSILTIAQTYDANVAFEVIMWVDKRTGGPDENRRFSMWNFSDLPTQLEWYGLEHMAVPVVCVAKVSDFTLRFTCPKCGACREGKQTRENVTTWREENILHCRKCGYGGIVPDDYQARLVAKIGVQRVAHKK